MRAVGKDVKSSGSKSFFWLNGKLPCYVDVKNDVFTIFRVKHDNPVYRPSDEYSDDIHGTHVLSNDSSLLSSCGIKPNRPSRAGD